MRRLRLRWIVLGTLAVSGGAVAQDFEFWDFTGNIKSRLSFGAAVRTENPDASLIGKLNLNPNLCGASDCISFSGDTTQNQKLVNSPGAYFGANKDNGDLNYRRWGLVSGVSKLSEDFTLSWKEVTLKLSAFGFFDPVNYSKTEYHPDTTFQPSTTIRDPAVAHQLGQDWQLKDAFVTGKFNVIDHDFSASVGHQHIRWGESTFNALNSISQINPPSSVLLHQPGTPINEYFRPTPAVLLGTQLVDNLSLDLVYELSWEKAIPEPNGSFYSFLDVLKSNTALVSLGQFHEDPNGLQRLPFPGNAISNTSLTAQVLNEKYGQPRKQGQFGGKLTYYAADLNGGTEISFYALNYHSQLPYLSTIATDQSCMSDSTSFVDAFVSCNGFIGLNPTSGKEPLPIDTLKIFAEYPEDIQMFGTSFNTNIGKWSLAGEYSIRPNMPVQVDVTDLIFAGLQPAFPKQDLNLGLNAATIQQTVASLGTVIGKLPVTNPTLLLQDATALLNGLPAILGAVGQGGVTIPGRRSAVPDYLESYRGFTTQPNQIIHGYERMVVDQLDLTGIRAIGSSDNPIGADQILILTEVGFTHIWNMPNRSRLQLEGGDNNDTHASPGADGTGNSGQADARRLNPTQQKSGFASSFAWGYRMLAQFEYDNLFWDLNFKPSLQWQQDISGISPQPVQNFIAGTKTYVVGTVIESGQQWSGQVFYQGSTGGGTVNTQRDRDVIGMAISYTF
ncbi:MAG: hypothetical protein JWR07_4765 [Nevskia sp.]|nr:hypothetical protein [Nevskia sp.]